MIITETGNVGIGTTTPFQKLEVNGDINLGMPNVTGTSGGFGNRLYFLGAQGTPLYPNTSGNTDDSWIARYNAASDYSEVRLNLGDNCSDGEDAFVIQSGGAGCAANTVWFRFDNNGDAYKPGGGSWAVLSDIRLKKNVEPFNLGLQEIKKIKTVWYEYNGKNHLPDNGKKYVGVIAQDIQKDFPFMVTHYVNYDDPSSLSGSRSLGFYLYVNQCHQRTTRTNRSS